MKAISLWQPWASAMERGVKLNETRSWPTSYRGDLLICSAKRKPMPIEVGTNEDYETAMSLPYGCALCVVELYDCWTTDQINNLRQPISQAERDLGDYSPGRFAWLTRNLRRLRRPIPMRGYQGLWTLTPEHESLVRSMIV